MNKILKNITNNLDSLASWPRTLKRWECFFLSFAWPLTSWSCAHTTQSSKMNVIRIITTETNHSAWSCLEDWYWKSRRLKISFTESLQFRLSLQECWPPFSYSRSFLCTSENPRRRKNSGRNWCKASMLPRLSQSKSTTTLKPNSRSFTTWSTVSSDSGPLRTSNCNASYFLMFSCKVPLLRTS